MRPVVVEVEEVVVVVMVEELVVVLMVLLRFWDLLYDFK